jgi:hypothetical protein
MIISHKHKFIFIKPTKVAGTSIEVSLAKHCDKKDIITPITKFDKSSDEDKYSHPARNYKGFYNHIPPSEIDTLAQFFNLGPEFRDYIGAICSAANAFEPLKGCET